MTSIENNLLVAPPLAVYVHLPWCVAKCPYCDFNSHTAPQTLPQEKYVDCLLADLEHDLPLIENHSITSVFFGGGTPSLFAPKFIGQFLTSLRDRIPLDDDVEITLEANPGALEHGRFEGYRAAGVDRISLGVQSFNNDHLKALGRIHRDDHVLRAVEELKNAGFDNFNLDLMYGLPQQTETQAVDDLRQAIALEPTHLSHYQLTLEPGTVFYHRPPPLPDDDALWAMQVACQAQLATAGYSQYEVSAYALTNRQCKHNVNYWQFGDYLGLGAGAHGKITQPSTGKILRTVREKQPREYMNALATDRVEHKQVPHAELPFEFALNALRLNSGFKSELFATRTGLPLSAIAQMLDVAIAKNLLAERAGVWRPTALGARFLTDLQALFLADRDAQ